MEHPLTTFGPGRGVTSVSGGILCTGPNFDGAIANPSAVTPFPGSSGCSLM